MTTPAVNTSQSQSYSWHQVRRLNDGTVVSDVTGMDALQVRRKIRPASSTNFVRSDKTRSPSGWYHLWKKSTAWLGSSGVVNFPGPAGSYGSTTGSLLVDSIPSPNLSTVIPLLTNARLDALSKVSENTMQLNAALAQLNQTLKLTADFSTAAAQGLDSIMSKVDPKTGSPGLMKQLGRMSKWRKIPDRYLAYLFGIAPLADDLTNAVNQLVDFQLRGMDLSVILKSKAFRKDFLREFLPSKLHNGSTGFMNGYATGWRIMGTRVGYRFDVPSWYLDQAPIVTPFSTAYELTRMSFVFDWIVPIGDYVGALESAQFSPFFVEGWETMYIRDLYDELLPDNKQHSSMYVNATGRAEMGEMSRVKVSVFPSTIQSPPALNPLPSWHKAAIGLSLLTQAFKRWY